MSRYGYHSRRNGVSWNINHIFFRFFFRQCRASQKQQKQDHHRSTGSDLVYKNWRNGILWIVNHIVCLFSLDNTGRVTLIVPACQISWKNELRTKSGKVLLYSMLTPSWLIFRIVSFKDLLNVRNPEKEWSAYGFESCVFIMVIRAERKTRTNGQTFKLDFPGNLCREAFTIIAMLCGWGAFILCINLP